MMITSNDICRYRLPYATGTSCALVPHRRSAWWSDLIIPPKSMLTQCRVKFRHDREHGNQSPANSSLAADVSQRRYVCACRSELNLRVETPMLSEPVHFGPCTLTRGHSMLRLARTVCAGTLFFWMSMTGQAFADEFKDQAVSRLAQSLDPAIPVALGKAVVRQAALLHARELLAKYGRLANLDSGWNASAREWQAAEEELMQDVRVD